ncbi:MAG: tRNA (5-methylaminomethyl-2-thiouridine)(34)-methyltransferase MnmD [Culturomica sp.]|nr:tRNA (5-methylaminomethyl-2-thiouridine)(34)-methyltransferase MnmD [Culturomica sp.]
MIVTEDGSSSIYVPELNEHYHSVHGAIQESQHVFIKNGLQQIKNSPIRVLEAGFGTGLNAMLSLVYAENSKQQVIFHSIEKYPLNPTEIEHLNYSIFFPETKSALHALHDAEWGTETVITPYFSLHKQQGDFKDVTLQKDYFDIVFYDAFNPDVQPDLWTEETLGNFCRALKKDGLLVTYCVKGIVKQAMRNLGFRIERLPGPPGKHQMLRATKI